MAQMAHAEIVAEVAAAQTKAKVVLQCVWHTEGTLLRHMW